MRTNIRAEVSKKNPYWIEKNRYYELKYFCLQYPIWKQANDSLDGFSKRPDILNVTFKNRHKDPTANCAEARMFYSERIDMVEKTAEETDESLANYILKGVTEGLSYDTLKTKMNIPCCKDVYYNNIRKFYWLLNKVRN